MLGRRDEGGGDGGGGGGRNLEHYSVRNQVLLVSAPHALVVDVVDYQLEQVALRREPGLEIALGRGHGILGAVATDCHGDLPHDCLGCGGVVDQVLTGRVRATARDECNRENEGEGGQCDASHLMPPVAGIRFLPQN